jgi:hypothetical protein
MISISVDAGGRGGVSYVEDAVTDHWAAGDELSRAANYRKEEIDSNQSIEWLSAKRPTRTRTRNLEWQRCGWARKTEVHSSRAY